MCRILFISLILIISQIHAQSGFDLEKAKTGIQSFSKEFFEKYASFNGFGHLKNTRPQKRENNENELSEKKSNSTVLLTLGTNISSFLYEDGRWQLGFNFGFTLNFKVNNSLSLSLPVSYSRINAAPRNVIDQIHYYSSGDFIYKTLSDWQVSIELLELPVLLTHNLLNKNSYDVRCFFGPGLVLAQKDNSKIENRTKTDEIIAIAQYDSFPLELQNPLDLPFVNSINMGVRFHNKRLYLDLMYVLYPHNVKSINRINSISLRIGIDII